LGTQTSSISEQEHLASELKRYKDSHAHLEILNNFSQSIFTQKSIDDICWCIAKKAVAELGFEDCVVYLFDDSKQYLIQRATHGPKNPVDKEIFNPIKISIGTGIVGEVAVSGTAEIIPDTSDDPRYIEDDRSRASEITVPMIVNEKIVGVIDSEHPEKNFYTEKHLRILTSIATIAAIKIDEIQVRESLEVYKSNLEGIISDRTKEINLSLSQLEKSNANLRQFGYFVSHDLREPLRNITTYLNLIKRYLDKKENEDVDEMMTYALEGALRMDTLINNIQAFTMLGKDSLTPELINVPELIMSIKQNLSVLILEENATVEYRGVDEIITEKGLISVVIQNLIQNAIKYRHPDRYPKIKVSCEVSEEQIKFNIADNGIGIDAENQDKIFDLFSRVGSSAAKGSGIGLATCKRIIDHLNGHIVVSSILKEGSIFSFSVPSQKVVSKV